MIPRAQGADEPPKLVVLGSIPSGGAPPSSPQGGGAVCKTVAIGMVGSIPTLGTKDLTKGAIRARA